MILLLSLSNITAVSMEDARSCLVYPYADLKVKYQNLLEEIDDEIVLNSMHRK